MDGCYSFLVGAMGAAIEIAARFHSVAYNFAAAMITFRGHGMNGAFKAVKIMGDTIGDDFEGLIVIISTNFTLIHKTGPESPSKPWLAGAIE